jgi:hypothetical protein
MKKTFFKVFGIAIVIGALWVLSMPVTSNGPGRKVVERREAMNHGNYLWFALLNHRERYGSFPNEETMKKITEEKGIAPFALVSSNDYFRLLVAGGLESEKEGYCRNPSLPTHKPDNVISPLDQAFEKGEVGFAYVAGLSVDSPGDTPLLVAPLIPGTSQFDPNAFDGHAVVIFVDGTAKIIPIRQDTGLVMIRGKMLFDPSAPYWNGKVPDVKYPAR